MADTDFKIEIKDFQSLKSVKLNLIPGLNVITGRSNTGKSAVIRAVNCALFNIGDDDMVRGGKRYAGVQIDNGRHKLVFCRDSHGKNEKTAYQFDDGATQKKVGRAQLPEVAQMFNIRDVRMQNNTKMQLNFWFQNDKPFLMDKTSGQLYEFLSLSSCDKYTKILKRMIVDMKVQEADINNLTVEIDTLKGINIQKQDFVDKNVGFEDLYKRIITANQHNTKLDNIGDTIDRVKGCSVKINQSSQELVKVVDAIKKLPLEDLSSKFNFIASKSDEVSNLLRAIQSIQSLQSRIKTLSDERVKVKSDLDVCNSVISLVSKELDRIDVEDKRVQSLYSISYACYNKAKVIEKSKADLDVLRSKSPMLILESVSGWESSIDNFSLESDRLYTISRLIFNVNELLSKLSDKKSLLDSVLLKVKENAAELEELKASAGYCPYCGTVFGDHHHESEV